MMICGAAAAAGDFEKLLAERHSSILACAPRSCRAAAAAQRVPFAWFEPPPRSRAPLQPAARLCEP
jgi:hypothetical protein